MNDDERDGPPGPTIDWAEQLAAAWRARMAGEEHTLVTRAGASLGEVIETARGISARGLFTGFSRSLYLHGQRRDRTIAVHAIFGERCEIVSVNVRVRLYEPAPESGAKILRAALEQYGGWQYNSLSVESGALRAGAFEATIYFGAAVPFLATNLIDQPRLMSAQHQESYEKLLSILGVRWKKEGGALRAAHSQLRWPLARESLVRAYDCALAQGLRPAVYSTRLPVTQWARVERSSELRNGRLTDVLDCAIGRGLSTRRAFESRDLEDLDAFVQREFDFARSGLVWTAAVPGVSRPERSSASAQVQTNEPGARAPRRSVASQRRLGLRVLPGGKAGTGVDHSARRD